MSNYLAADDPLAGILSDGSDDSFFDEPRKPKTPEKKSVADIFNLTDSGENAKRDDWLGVAALSKSRESGFETEKSTTSIPAPGRPAKKISFEDDDDLLGTLGLGKKAAPEPQQPSKKYTLEEDEDILGSLGLGGKKLLKPEDAQIIKPKPVGSNKGDDLLESILGKKSEERRATETSVRPQTSKSADVLKEPKPETYGFQGFEGAREGRRGRRGSSGLIDPLGLFSNESNKNLQREETAAQQPTASSTADEGLPNWLGATTKPATPKKAQTVTVEQQKPQEVPVKNAQNETGDNNNSMVALLTQQQLAHSNIELQNTAMALQQQESQLLMAIQLKKYEDNLTEMQKQQQQLLLKQEQQFNTLLEKQFAKQQLVENNMKLQQERINNHIQLLLSQPPLPKDSATEATEELKKSVSDESSKLYEKMIESLKQRQREEVFLLEESYKKQITLLEETMESVESRLKTELSTVAASYGEKIKALKEEHESEKLELSDRIRRIASEHAEEIKQIRENQNRVVQEIKYEHATLIESVKEAKRSEGVLFKDANSFAQKLDSNIQVLQGSSRALLELQGKLDEDYSVLSVAREESLKVKEQEIEAMRKTLDKCRESSELERAQLMSLVRTLESKLSEQTMSAREDRWALQQAAATLTARSAALERESEFAKASLEREREQLKTLKETLLAEQEKALLRLTEEKLSLSAEKSRLETSSKLVLSYDAQRTKAETEAALQVAKEATELAERERENLQKQHYELENLKRSLKDKERRLTSRDNELTQLILNAERKSQEGEKCLAQARLIERNYTDRLKELQNQVASVASREKKLAEEKIALSKERLGLHAAMRQSRRCALCAADAPQNSELHVDFINQEIPRLLAVHDPDVLRLRLMARDDENEHLKSNVEETDVL